MEASGYAAVMADLMKEKVHLVELNDQDPPVKWIDKLMYVRDKDSNWHPIRACFRLTTKTPKIPPYIFLDGKIILEGPP